MSRIRPWSNGDQVALDGGKVPVIGPLTDAELRASGVPVTGPLTDTELRAAAVPISMADRTVLLYDAAGNALSSTVNVDRTTNLDGLRGLNVNSMNFGRVSDTIVKNFRLDASTEALMTVSYAHHETHAGSHFNYRDSYEVSKNTVVEHLVITPNTTKWAHMIFGVASTGGQVDLEVFEGTTVSANGVLEPVMNRNRNSAAVNTTLVYHQPTVTTAGTRLYQQTYGVDDKDSAGGGNRDHDEIILKQNTLYLIRTTELNVDKATINIDLDWYEHTNRN